MKIKALAQLSILLNIIPLLFTFFMFFSLLGIALSGLYFWKTPNSKIGKIVSFIILTIVSLFGLAVTIITIPELKNNF